MDDDLQVPTGRAFNRARLFNAASDIIALADLFDPADCEAVALKLEEEAHALPEPGRKKAAVMIANAIRVAAGISGAEVRASPTKKRTPKRR